MQEFFYCAIGGLLIAAGFFMNGYSIIANTRLGGTANSGEVTEWLLIVVTLLLRSALVLTRQLIVAMNSATLAITRQITFLFLFSRVTFTGSLLLNLSSAVKYRLMHLERTFAKGYIF